MIKTETMRVSPATQTKGKPIRRWQAKNTTSVLCPVCGQTFVLCSAAQRYCSPACRCKAQERRRAQKEAGQERKKQRERHLEETVARAEFLGLSYGKYRAMQAIGAVSIATKTS